MGTPSENGPNESSDSRCRWIVRGGLTLAAGLGLAILMDQCAQNPSSTEPGDSNSEHFSNSESSRLKRLSEFLKIMAAVSSELTPKPIPSDEPNPPSYEDFDQDPRTTALAEAYYNITRFCRGIYDCTLNTIHGNTALWPLECTLSSQYSPSGEPTSIYLSAGDDPSRMNFSVTFSPDQELQFFSLSRPSQLSSNPIGFCETFNRYVLEPITQSPAQAIDEAFNNFTDILDNDPEIFSTFTEEDGTRCLELDACGFKIQTTVACELLSVGFCIPPDASFIDLYSLYYENSLDFPLDGAYQIQGGLYYGLFIWDSQLSP